MYTDKKKVIESFEKGESIYEFSYLETYVIHLHSKDVKIFDKVNPPLIFLDLSGQLKNSVISLANEARMFQSNLEELETVEIVDKYLNNEIGKNYARLKDFALRIKIGEIQSDFKFDYGSNLIIREFSPDRIIRSLRIVVKELINKKQ